MEEVYSKIQARLDRVFSLHKPDEFQGAMCDHLRARARDLAYHIVTSTPECHEKDKALELVDEALRWAIAAVVRPPEVKS